MWRNIIRHLLDIPRLWQHEHFCRSENCTAFFFFCTSESSSESWPLRRELGNMRREERVERVHESVRAAYFVACVHPAAHGSVTVLSARFWTASGCKSSGLNSPVPALTVITAPPTPLHPSIPMEANSTNRQQCLAEVEGKLVREVKVNNIPYCIQQARNCLFCVSKEEEENKGGQLSNP